MTDELSKPQSPARASQERKQAARLFLEAAAIIFSFLFFFLANSRPFTAFFLFSLVLVLLLLFSLPLLHSLPP